MSSYKVQLVLTALGVAAAAAPASATITLSPSTAGVIAGTGYGPSNCENIEPTNCVETVFGASDLDLLYKANVGGSDEGPYASSYTTFFYDTFLDPSDAWLFHDGGPVISCTECYLAIKDGAGSPGYYFYDLSGWNGLEWIVLDDFWPGDVKGAISHISIWGGTASSVPEPATIALFGLGLLGAGMARRRKKA